MFSLQAFLHGTARSSTPTVAACLSWGFLWVDHLAPWRSKEWRSLRGVFPALRAYMWYWKLSSALPACSLWEPTHVEDIVQWLTYSQCSVNPSCVCKCTHVCLSRRRMASVFLNASHPAFWDKTSHWTVSLLIWLANLPALVLQLWAPHQDFLFSMWVLS